MKLGNTEQHILKRQIRPDVMSAMQAMAQSAAVNGVSDMSFEAINSEIDVVRKEQ